MTQAQAVQLVMNAVGQRITTAHGYTNPFLAQCLSFIAWYTEQLGYPSIMPGYNAIDVFTRNPLNLPKVISPQPGDIFFMDYYSGNTNYGHTGVVTEVTPTGIYSVDQNWFNSNLNTGSPATGVFHPFNTIRGYLRPDFKGDEMVTNEQVNDLYLELVGRPASQGDLNQWTGKEWPIAYYGIKDSPEGKKHAKDEADQDKRREDLEVRLEKATTDLKDQTANHEEWKKRALALESQAKTGAVDRAAVVEYVTKNLK